MKELEIITEINNDYTKHIVWQDVNFSEVGMLERIFLFY
jgi:hypothetical protein